MPFQCAYVIDSDDLRSSLPDHQLGLNLPSYSDRAVRATKFPRIGRSPSDVEDISSAYDANADESEDTENEFRWLEQRSVLFPRIGKRAFHNIVWGNGLSNPHRMLDAQGRYHIDGYGYHVHPNSVPAMAPFRGKRSISM